MPEPTTRSRREVLSAMAGGAAAFGVGALAAPAAVLGADGESLVLGQQNEATSATVLDRSGGGDFEDSGMTVTIDTGSAIHGVGGWAGVLGHGSQYGVAGKGTGVAGVGILGHAEGGSTGVIGSSGIGPPPARYHVGVYGIAELGTGARGVLGVSLEGQGVRGETASGTAGAFAAQLGSAFAVRTNGRIQFNKVSGIAYIAGGKDRKVILPGVDMTVHSFILLTPRSSLRGRDLWYTVDPVDNTFTLRVSSAVSSTLAIGWLLLG